MIDGKSYRISELEEFELPNIDDDDFRTKILVGDVYECSSDHVNISEQLKNFKEDDGDFATFYYFKCYKNENGEIEQVTKSFYVTKK